MPVEWSSSPPDLFLRLDRSAPVLLRDQLETALRDVRPSVGPWFETARNVAMFANDDGSYDDLLAYLRKHRRL